MRLRILIAPDKFKGTLPANEAAEAIARGWRRAGTGDRLELLPVTDGGDGFGDTMSRLLGFRLQNSATVNATGRPCVSQWWWDAKTKTALIESASVIGLALLPPGEFHPFQLDTRGLGLLLKAARAKRARKCLLGIGGSATNDGGFGMARALGWEFLDRDGRSIESWTGLKAVTQIRRPPRGDWFSDVVIAVDVQNPLLGLQGATRVYGPQKGLRPQDFRQAEACLGALARVAVRQFGKDLARLPGAGAAGGLGFGLTAFAGGTLIPGFEMFAAHAKLESRIRAANLVITGEGRLDSSSFMGKAAGQIALLCRRYGVPCIALAGEIHAPPKTLKAFERTFALAEVTSLASAKARPAFWLERLAEHAARWKEQGSAFEPNSRAAGQRGSRVL